MCVNPQRQAVSEKQIKDLPPVLFKVVKAPPPPTEGYGKQ